MIMNNPDPLTKRVMDHRSVLEKIHVSATKNMGHIDGKTEVSGEL
jgi:hypothetical protein